MNRSTDKDKQGYVKDLSMLSKRELLDLRNRQQQLLRNKNRILNLPDKGLKLQKFYEEILHNLKTHDDVNLAEQLLSELNIASIGKKSLTKMEWNIEHNDALGVEAIVGSGDDRDIQKSNPLAGLAQSNIVEQKIVHSASQPSLIDQHQTIELGSGETSGKSSDLSQEMTEEVCTVHLSETYDVYSTNLCKKEVLTSIKEKFLPFRTTKTNVHDTHKERHRYIKCGKNWDISSATPPSIAHGPAKMISLDESIRIQTEKNSMIQAMQNIHAKERLKRRIEIKERLQGAQQDVVLDSFDMNAYRTMDPESDNEKSSEEENYTFDRFHLDSE